MCLSAFHNKNPLVGGEVWIFRILWDSSPQSLALGRLGFSGFHIRKDDVTIELTFVYPSSRCVKTGSTARDSLPSLFHALLTNEHEGLGHIGVKRNNGELGILGKA